MRRYSLAACALVGLFLWTGRAEARLARSLAAAAGRDTTCTVWVVFTDKPSLARRAPWPNTRALERRRRAGYPAVSAGDYPVPRQYIEAVRDAGGRLRHTFPWANAASFTVDARRFARIDALPFVQAILPVAVHRMPMPPGTRGGMGKAAAVGSAGVYGRTWRELAMLNVPRVQAHILKTLGQEPGEGVIIGMFDTGFWLDHAAFNHIVDSEAVVADSDFVDPGSEPYQSFPDHGAETMSLIGGYDPGSFVGAAWGAKFILARTENDGPEEHVEEDHWAAAMVWAEALGVDIVSSSLGYFAEFNDSIGDYTFEDMDGKTTIISKAAAEATKRGVLVVNAMGNYYQDTELLINAPADVEDVISVGAVDSSEEIAWFSCHGPTADGRLKPDVVAMGAEAAVVSYEDGYSVDNGTSFATPLVAGAVALIKQLYPDDSAAGIRQRLYASCRYAAHQDTIDTVYGRGIPDLGRIIGDSTTTYLCLLDTLGQPIEGARAHRGPALLDTSNELGLIAVDHTPVQLPDTVLLTHAELAFTHVVLDSVGAWRNVVMRRGYPTKLTLTEEEGEVFLDGTAYWRAVGGSVVDSVEVRRGIATVTFADTQHYSLWGSAPFHYPSDTIAYQPFFGPDSISLRLSPWPSLTISLSDSLGDTVRQGTVYWRPAGADTYHSSGIDSDGMATIRYASGGLYEMRVESRGYETLLLSGLSPDTVSGSRLHLYLLPKARAVVRVCDSACSSPIVGATIVWWPGDSLTRHHTPVDSIGVATLILQRSSRYHFYAEAEGYYASDTSRFHSDSIGDTISVSLRRRPGYLAVWVTDTSDTGRRVGRGTVHARRTTTSVFQGYAIDSSSGTALVPATAHERYVVYVTAPGYRRSSEVSFAVHRLPDTLRIVLEPRPVSHFAVYPTVLSISRLESRRRGSSRGITIDFLAADDDPRKHDQVCRIAVRTVSGDLVWGFSAVLREREPVQDEQGRLPVWNCRARDGEYVAPGTYLVTVEYAGKTHTRKVLVGG